MDFIEFEDCIEVACDGCDRLFGSVAESEYGEWRKKLHLCPSCTPANCSMNRLVEVGGYRDYVISQVDEWKAQSLPIDHAVEEYIKSGKN